MVDNFEQIRYLLKFDNPGDCYYLQLLRRQADDPHTDGKADPNYHGNMHSRSIKDYLISSLDYYDQKKDEIKKICDTFNVRAYIRLNKRTYFSIAMAILKHIVEQLTSGQTFNSPFSLIASAAGNANAAGKEKTWILDLDEEYVPFKDDIYKMIVECEPYNKMFEEWRMSSIPGSTEQDYVNAFITVSFSEIQTKHGKHIISKPFNTAALTKKWNQYCESNGVTMPLPRMFNDPEDKFTIFELTDVYLPIADEFASFLPEYEKTQSDSNKISFVVPKMTDWEVHMLDFYWKGNCLKNKRWMRMFDIHKDNPTILYVP